MIRERVHIVFLPYLTTAKTQTFMVIDQSFKL